MNDNINTTENTEQEIDLIELIGKLWNKRWFIFKACCVGGIIGLVIAFSIPKEYTTTVILAPETNSGSTGNIGALAAMAGINLNQPTVEMSPELYPEIIKSTPFLLGLLDMKVSDKKLDINTSLYTYLEDYQKSTWWSYVFSFPFKVLGWFRPSSTPDAGAELVTSIIFLTKEEEGILSALKSNINISVDKKTNIITLNVAAQSASVSATLVDTLSVYMQDYIIHYRTEKARRDLAFTQDLYEESKESYYKAQQTYANYIDKNQGIISASFRTTQERLQNEMNLAYNVYNQMSQQLQVAKIKTQDMTPVCKIIQPAVMPIGASAPNKMIILLGFVFLAFAGVCCWVLFGKGLLAKLK